MDEREFNRRTRELFGRIAESIVNRPWSQKRHFLAAHRPGQDYMLLHLLSELGEARVAVDSYIRPALTAPWSGAAGPREPVYDELADVMFLLACANALGRPRQSCVRQDLHLSQGIANAIRRGGDGHRDLYIARFEDGGPLPMEWADPDQRVECMCEWLEQRLADFPETPGDHIRGP